MGENLTRVCIVCNFLATGEIGGHRTNPVKFALHQSCIERNCRCCICGQLNFVNRCSWASKNGSYGAVAQQNCTLWLNIGHTILLT